MNGLVSLPQSAGVQRSNGEGLCRGDCGSVPSPGCRPHPVWGRMVELTLRTGAMESTTAAAAFRVCTLTARTVPANIRHLKLGELGLLGCH